MVTHYDEGRSKSKFCLAATFLPIPVLKRILAEMQAENHSDRKELAKKINFKIDQANKERLFTSGCWATASGSTAF
jgi:hypothetical protein